MIKTFVETQRLLLREFLPTDIDDFFELDSDPEVNRYLGNKPITDKSQIAKLIDYVRQQYVDNGIGRWAVIHKETGKLMGWAGLKYITDLTNNHQYYYDLGYRFMPKYWRQGFATEAASAVLTYAFERLNADVVYAMAHRDNVGSNKVLRKVGLQFVEAFELENEPLNWYELRRNAWEAIPKIS